MGEATFKEWHVKKGEHNSEWIFKDDIKNIISDEIEQKINILPFADKVAYVSENEVESFANEQTIEHDDAYAGQSATDTNTRMTDHTVNKSIVFNQNGNNNIQAENIGSLAINYE